MSIQITDAAFGMKALGALDAATKNIELQQELGLISPQEAANLKARFMNLEAQVARGTADAIDREVGQMWTQPTLWGDAA